MRASYEVAYIISKEKKPHLVGETLIKLCCSKIPETLFNEDMENEVQR